MAKTNPEWLRYVELMEQRPELFVNNGLINIELDEAKVTEFEERTGKRAGVLYESPYSRMVVDLVSGSSGDYFLYERIIPHSSKNGVVILPIHNGKVVLLNQYRHSLRGYQLSIPRGYGEDGMETSSNAAKEIEEELGAVATNIEFLGTINSNSGISGGIADVYMCDIDRFTQKHGYEGIDSVIELSEDELRSYISSGKINDGFTLSALCYYWTRG